MLIQNFELPLFLLESDSHFLICDLYILHVCIYIYTQHILSIIQFYQRQVAQWVCFQDTDRTGQGVVGEPPSVRVLKWTDRDSSSGLGGRLYSSLVIK